MGSTPVQPHQYSYKAEPAKKGYSAVYRHVDCKNGLITSPGNGVTTL